VTEDGTFLATARFESEDAARANSQRPEQDRWWSETSQLFSGEPTFLESTEVDVDLTGDPDRAGFVQVIQGRTSDPDRARELMKEGPDDWSSFRPDMLGSVSLGHDEGNYTVVLYFTSEEEARRRRAQGSAARAQGPDGRDGEARGRRAHVLRSQAALAVLTQLNRTAEPHTCTVRIDYVRYPRSHRELG
jgi:hypothetical protein